MHRTLRTIIPSAVMALGPACGSAPISRHHVADDCPSPPGVRGYPVTVRLQPAVAGDAATSVARATTDAWSTARVPGPALDAAQRAALVAAGGGGEPYSRDGWTPKAADTATIVASIGGTAPAIITLTGGANTSAFDRLALRAVDAGLRRDSVVLRSVRLQSRRSDLATTVRLTVRFGLEPEPGDGVARFAVQERAIRGVATNAAPRYPEALRSLGVEGDVRISYIVTSEGLPVLETVRVHGSPDHEFTRAVDDAVRRFRFVPHQRDCQPVAIAVQQPFRFRLRR